MTEDRAAIVALVIVGIMVACALLDFRDLFKKGRSTMSESVRREARVVQGSVQCPECGKFGGVHDKMCVRFGVPSLPAAAYRGLNPTDQDLRDMEARSGISESDAVRVRGAGEEEGMATRGSVVQPSTPSPAEPDAAQRLMDEMKNAVECWSSVVHDAAAPRELTAADCVPALVKFGWFYIGTEMFRIYERTGRQFVACVFYKVVENKYRIIVFGCGEPHEYCDSFWRTDEAMRKADELLGGVRSVEVKEVRGGDWTLLYVEGGKSVHVAKSLMFPDMWLARPSCSVEGRRWDSSDREELEGFAREWLKKDAGAA